MEQSLYPGSQTFEQALCRLYLDGVIAYDEALTASDSPTNLAWLVNQNSPSARVEGADAGDEVTRRAPAGFAKLEISPEFLNRDR
jgi:twitching motility protein PilU